MNITYEEYAFDLDESLIEASPSEIRRQIREYEAGERRSFDLTVSYPNTFTGQVMKAMREIPYGETRTYGDIAQKLDSAPIAVGQACGRNPVAPVVPCHRVVRSDGSLGGYSGDGGLEMKRALLKMEAENAET